MGKNFNRLRGSNNLLILGNVFVDDSLLFTKLKGEEIIDYRFRRSININIIWLLRINTRFC